MNEDNYIKKIAKELNMTYRELGEAIGVSDTTLASSVSNDKVSTQIATSLKLLTENIRLKKEIDSLKNKDLNRELKIYNQLKSVLKDILNDEVLRWLLQLLMQTKHF